MDTSVTIDLSFLDEMPPPRPRRHAVAASKPVSNMPVEWNAAEALRLEETTDELVAALGVSGLDPSIQDAAERCLEAHRRRDLQGIRTACEAMRQRVTQLSAHH